MRIVIIAIAAAALVGCAPKDLPDWAVSGPVAGGPVLAPLVRTVERQRPDRGPSSRAAPATPEAEILPFTPEWQAREDAHDRRLRRSMNICRNC